MPHVAPFLGILALAMILPFVGNDYWALIGTRAAIYWVLVSGLNLVVGFAGQLAIGYVALLTLGAYTTSVLVAGNVDAAACRYSPRSPIAGCVGAVFGVVVGLPALRLRTFYFAMSTLGFATIVTQIALAWQSVTGGGIGIAGPEFPAPFDTAVGLLLALHRRRRRLHLDDRQRRPQPLRPRADRGARRRSGGRGHRHLQAAAADRDLPVLPARWRPSPAGCSRRCRPTSRRTPSPSTCRCCSSSRS